jgi:hypothetical protein
MALITRSYSILEKNKEKKETHGGTALVGDFEDDLPLSLFDAGALSFSSLGTGVTLPLFPLVALELIKVQSDSEFSK